jgi:hypothetical protein
MYGVKNIFIYRMDTSVWSVYKIKTSQLIGTFCNFFMKITLF